MTDEVGKQKKTKKENTEKLENTTNEPDLTRANVET